MNPEKLITVSFIITGLPDVPCAHRISAQTTNDKHRHAGEFLGAVQLACTRWATEDRPGQKAWENTHRDFNIGDLFDYDDSLTLQAQLRQVGISDLRVELLTGDTTAVWEHDTVLVDHTLLEEDTQPQGKTNHA